VRAVTLAKVLGVTRTTYYRYETGARRAYWDQVYTVAVYLGVPVDWFVELPNADRLLALAKMRNERRSAEITAAAPVVEHQAEIEAIHSAGAVMGDEDEHEHVEHVAADGSNITDLIKEWEQPQ
jgi:transcriptional regulator with XRE-family HTH domain